MKNPDHDKGRRAILKGLVAVPVVAIAGFHSTAYATMLSADDPTAKALAYTDKSTVEGKSCSNCMLYQGGTAATGPCPIFPGKEVAATGWCKSWAAKP